jgi:prepilin-type N-terminal cleavage/methylation domain-containing protein
MLLSRVPVRRSGLSLLEVLVALAIFLMAITALWHLVGLATDHAQEAHHRAQAARIAQSKMHLVLAGKYPLSAVEEMAADDDDPGIEDDDDLKSYRWSLVVNDTSVDDHPFAANVYLIEVHVTREMPGRPPIEVVLSQIVMDPSQSATSMDALLPQSSTNTPSLGYTIPGGPTGSTTTGSTTGN